MNTEAARKLGQVKSKRKALTSKENSKKAKDIRARLTIYGHEQMTDEAFLFFKRWVRSVASEMQSQKRGDLSKIFRATLYK